MELVRSNTTFRLPLARAVSMRVMSSHMPSLGMKQPRSVLSSSMSETAVCDKPRGLDRGNLQQAQSQGAIARNGGVVQRDARVHGGFSANRQRLEGGEGGANLMVQFTSGK